LTKAVEVSVPRGGQDIFVRVSHEIPGLAQTAVNVILDEYAKIAIDQEATQMQDTIDLVSDLREEARRERDEARSRAYRLAESEGTDDLARRREAKHEQVEQIERLLLDINLRLLPFETASANVAGSPSGTGEVTYSVPLESLAQRDRVLDGMLARRADLEYEVASLQQRYGPEHRKIAILQDELEGLQTMIEARAATVQAATPDGSGGIPVEAQLRLQKERLEVLLAEAIEEARRFGKLQLDIDRLREEAGRADEKFREADSRLESLMVQKRDGQQGRISVSQRAETPLAPSTDRRIPLAVLGALGGGGIGVGLVVLFGLVKPRYRFIDDIESEKRPIRIVGAIPEIDADDPAARQFIATSVHQIRTAIDARLLGPSEGGLVHVVTSASAGEGKSTLSLRLARSFAVSGKRTLIIDADLIGRRMSSKFCLRSVAGLTDALTSGADPLTFVHGSDHENLSIMPAGQHAEFQPERVSAAAIATLLDRLRPEFGAIVIDTGPILGSIEAQAIVPASDEVLLVVSRGRGVRLVRQAIDRLHRLEAPRIGVVFNRATFNDLERSTSISMTSQRVSERLPDDDAYDVAGVATGNGSQHAGD
jgi:capsular exopolysaccharide synthesis family protein